MKVILDNIPVVFGGDWLMGEETCFMMLHEIHRERAAHMLEIGCTAQGWPKRYLVGA